MKRALFVVPPPLPDLTVNHEATAGIGSLGPGPKGFAYPPHLVASCVASAREHGWETTVADGTRSAMQAFVTGTETAGHEVLAVQVGVGSWLSDLTYLRLLQHHFRASGNNRPALLMFGPSAGQVAIAALEEGVVDAAQVGEPELAVGLALERVSEGHRGLIGAKELRPDGYDASGLITDLDLLPMPAWEAVPWQSYGMVTLLSSRGCPEGCHYCAYTLSQGTRTRRQSVERTLAEWKRIDAVQRPPRLVLRDTVFAQDRARVAALCEGLLTAGVQGPWECESRPEHFDRDLLALMKRAGCSTIKIGMESGDPKLLARLGRIPSEAASGEYLAQVRRVAEWCREADLRCRVFVLTGLPGQTADSYEMTRSELARLPRSAVINPSLYRAYPGVKLEGQPQPVAPAMQQRLQQPHSTPLYRRALGRIRRWLRAAPPPVMPPPAMPVAEQRAQVEASRPRSPRPLPQQYLLTGSRVFLTGGSGFVGGYVARALVDAGVQVVALLRPDSDPGPLGRLPGVEIVLGDLLTPASWSAALQGCRFCFHVAALYAGPEQAEELMKVNAWATGSLLAACAEAHVARFIHTGTVGTVGRPMQAGVLPDETTAFNLWDQASPYVRSKYLGELVARSWNGAGVDVVVVKPTAPVGAGDARPTATGKRILAALTGRMGSYPPGGINHAPVTDIAAGHLAAAERGQAGETYLLGHCAGNLDRAGFLQKVAEAATATGLSMPADGNRPPASSGLLDALTADPRRAVEELGMPQSDLSAAFRESVAWYSAQGWARRSLEGEKVHVSLK